MDKFLLFNEAASLGVTGDAAHDVACYPLSKFKGFTNTGTTDTELQMIFEALEEGPGDDAVYTITLTITQNRHVEAMKDISNAIASNISGVIVISDRVGSEYVSSYVTASSISVATAD